MKPWRKPDTFPKKGKYPSSSVEVMVCVADPYTSAKLRITFGIYLFENKEWSVHGLARIPEGWILGWKYKPKLDRQMILKSQQIAAQHKKL